ncbi:hypothetical protein FNT36_14370 [Hymenobacter setariae]|uniref:Uncharacterized protein n=1 Tax=Hymenobacter setariae TaxID=2594794 RepID=A0A558BVU6_9BACT|nr:hypothetical protein [Hymenobacter setariae]TVT40650.1 hypothetical protein FNT36_14370 [Hymenobacter setariae]
MNSLTCIIPIEPTTKVCRKCGIPQPLERFPFEKARQTHRGTCKACRAAESRALRSSAEHAERIREAERIRSKRRRPYILKWQREHPDNMLPGYRRRAARRKERLAAARLAAAQATPQLF